MYTFGGCTVKFYGVGCGKNNRGRPDCKSSWSGRPQSLLDILEVSRHKIKVQVFPCTSKEVGVNLERTLIKKLKPIHNTAPQAGGWKGMHTARGLKAIKDAQTGKETSKELREARSKRMKGNKNLLGHKHSAETKRKISEAGKGRAVSDLCRLKASQRMSERNRTNPPRKGKKCSAEHRKNLSLARKKRNAL